MWSLQLLQLVFASNSPRPAKMRLTCGCASRTSVGSSAAPDSSPAGSSPAVSAADAKAAVELAELQTKVMIALQQEAVDKAVGPAMLAELFKVRGYTAAQLVAVLSKWPELAAHVCGLGGSSSVNVSSASSSSSGAVTVPPSASGTVNAPAPALSHAPPPLRARCSGQLLLAGDAPLPDV